MKRKLEHKLAGTVVILLFSFIPFLTGISVSKGSKITYLLFALNFVFAFGVVHAIIEDFSNGDCL